MKLVVDTNIPFAALVAWDGTTRDLIFSNELELFSPELMNTELEKYISLIVEKSGLPSTDVETAKDLIFSKIKVVPLSESKLFLKKAASFSPDPNDVEFFALALALNCPLWSNDKALCRQTEVKVLSTLEVLGLVKKQSSVSDE